MVAESQNVSCANATCIVGIGACTAVGLNAASTAAAVRVGISGFEEHPFMINQQGEPYLLATVPSVDPALTGSDRYIALSTSAIQEALEPLQKMALKKQGIKVVVALPEVRPGLPENLSEKIANHIMAQSNQQYIMNDVRMAFNGHAAGLMALESAHKHLSNGESEFYLIGGIESYIDPDTLDWVEDNEQLHVPSNAWGFMPGEAACFCLVCLADTANKYKLPVKVKRVAISTAHEKNKIKTQTVCIGEGLTQAVKGVLSKLPKNAKIDYTICDQNGEAYRADEFGFMLSRLSKYFTDPSDYMAPADCWGDVGAASGPLFINLIAAAYEKRYAKGPYTLLWTSSESGERTAALFWTHIEERKIN
ncbi:hypothetical protein MNBD_GAMMA08-2499 [hydrothermal vent metagenome]|uniref:Beta-ketoacyl synthase N-terminal domain-containing protein n=1 Tax=hydrothermal vent metagenome TaxID=652676 RepID=A0A3B0WTT3_9ZZZZ